MTNQQCRDWNDLAYFILLIAICCGFIGDRVGIGLSAVLFLITLSIYIRLTYEVWKRRHRD